MPTETSSPKSLVVLGPSLGSNFCCRLICLSQSRRRCSCISIAFIMFVIAMRPTVRLKTQSLLFPFVLLVKRFFSFCWYGSCIPSDAKPHVWSLCACPVLSASCPLRIRPFPSLPILSFVTLRSTCPFVLRPELLSRLVAPNLPRLVACTWPVTHCDTTEQNSLLTDSRQPCLLGVVQPT